MKVTAQREQVALGEQTNNNPPLKMKYPLMAAAFLASLTTSYGQTPSVTLDGIYNSEDVYTNSETVTWFNGHKSDESIYGDFDNQSFTTTIRYGIAELDGDDTTRYFFLHVEAPLIAKNMIWGNNLTEDDLASYRIQHETHHRVGDLNLDFGGATGSEKLIFLNAVGAGEFEAQLAGGSDSDFGLIEHKDSVDYLIDSGISTLDSSLARDTTMSFEFQFAIDENGNSQGEALVALARNGLEFHLSPERGLTVPEPSSSLLIGLSSLAFLLRRKR